MANQEFSGFLYDDSGAAIVGATINLYDRNTTTPVRATTTTDANGYWAISHATEGRFDVEIVNGTSKRRRKYDTAEQITYLEVQSLRVRNPAFTFDYVITPGAITADRTLNLPVITGTDTLSVLGLAQTYSAIKTFSAVPVMSGGAVGFPATQVASATANDLDDYEEGTWTPAIGGTATYTTQIGRYIKVGKAVWITCDLEINSLGSGSTTTISGLPFTSVTSNSQALAVAYFASIAGGNVVMLTAYQISNSATVNFAGLAAAGASMSAAQAIFGNSARVIFAGVYEASA